MFIEERREIYTELTKIKEKNSADFGVVVINGILIVRRITSIKFLKLLNNNNNNNNKRFIPRQYPTVQRRLQEKKLKH